jgi:probable O-glycosylation ligase (exosortase A-associated)
MALVLGIKSNYKMLSTVAIACVLALSIAFMPENWQARMETIATYEQDSSAQGRLQAWEMAWNLAIDRPIVGGGHDFLTNESVWYTYQSIGTPRAAHSIYFQVLGEHGFIGLVLYILIGLNGWLLAKRVARETARHPEFEWAPLLMRMIQVSLIGFAVGGAFLSLANWDLPYYLVAIVAMVAATFREAQKRDAKSLQRAPGAAQSREPPQYDDRAVGTSHPGRV